MLLNLYFWLGLVIIALTPLGFVGRIFTRRLANRFNPFDMVTLRVLLPKESLEVEDLSRQREIRQMIAPIESFMANLAGLRAERGWNAFWFGRKDHFAFEIVADEGVISFYVTVPQELRQFVEQQIQAQAPDAFIEEREDYNIFNPQCAIAACALGFKKSYYFPIKNYQEMEFDPLNALTNSLSKFRDDAHGGAAIQFVLRSAHPRWHAAASQLSREVRVGKKLSDAVKLAGHGPAKTAMRTIIHSRKKSPEELERMGRHQETISQFEEEALSRIQEKSAKSAFEANIRIVVATGNESIANAALSAIADSFSQYAGYEYGNGFIRKKPRNLKRFLNDFIYRNFRERSQIILNTAEMASLFHFPLPSAETPNILWLSAKQAAAPVNMPTEGLILGHNTYRGEDTVVRIKLEDRRRHLYLIGKSGTGKSVLIANMARQDIVEGRGVCVIDPHGDLVDAVLSYVPESRAQDVIYFDPSDLERPMGLNMLEYKDDSQKDFAVQDMIRIFEKLFPPEVIGPMFEHNMRNVMLTLMADKEHPGTIVDIPRMFTDPEFQKYKVSKLLDPNVRSFWEQEMAKTSDFHKSEMLGYLVSKVGRFVENEMLRNIIGQARSAFDFRDVMDNKKILLINLAKGKTGEVNSALLGLIIVSKLQMAAMTRAELPEAERHDFYLYIDEFQNFVTDSIATILSEARKYRLNLIISHQYIGQLVDAKGNTQIKDAVFGNVGTVISFKIGVEDAETVAKEFAPVFNEYDCINIDKYQAYVKLLIDNASAKPFQMSTYPPSEGSPERAAAIREASRNAYGSSRAEIEADIAGRLKLGKAPSADEQMEAEIKKSL
ncbi:MAG: type IV secretory system conjugative DNA transfer family protein [Parcubacteria group bacterium]|nr:type IV secretory system conjugative DNA transfer family protein [Parcubacteria group bacterium]